MSLYASCPCGIPEGSNEAHLRTDCPLYGLPPKGNAMTDTNTDGAKADRMNVAETFTCSACGSGPWHNDWSPDFDPPLCPDCSGAD